MQEFTGLEYVKIDVANQYGNGIDKLTFKQKIAWVDKNRKKLLNMHTSAKTKPRYLKAVLALQDAERGKPSGHLVGLDASASGAQILSVLAGCVHGCKATGLIGNRPSDLYTKTMKAMHKILGYETSVSRDEIKQAQMPFFYGSKQQPKNVFGEGTDAYQAFFTVQNQLVPGAVQLMDIMINAWQPYTDEHVWVMPDGFTCRIPVIQTEQKKIEVDEADHLTFEYRTQVIAGKEKGLSLAANITHAIDAWVVRELVKYCDFDLITIHDEFLCHPNNMNKVREAYRMFMAEIAGMDLFNDILSQIVGSDYVPFEKLNGNLCPEILKSNYAIN